MKKSLFPIAIAIATSAVAIFAPTAFAQSTILDGVNAARGEGQPSELFGDGGVVSTITNIMLFIIGALSVVMIIWGGIRYTISGGSSSAVSAAKNTIMYALIGLVIAFLAFAIVNFVLGAIAPGGGAGFTNV